MPRPRDAPGDEISARVFRVLVKPRILRVNLISRERSMIGEVLEPFDYAVAYGHAHHAARWYGRSSIVALRGRQSGSPAAARAYAIRKSPTDLSVIAGSRDRAA